MSGRGGYKPGRVDWQRVVLPRAVQIVNSYTTGVTLRQCFYRLVAEGLIPNTQGRYRQLSTYSAEWRREGKFPDFIDQTRRMHGGFGRHGDSDPTEALKDALEGAVESFHLTRTEGQPWNIYLGVEKRGIIEQLKSWFRDLPVPILELGGYTSQTYVKDVGRDIASFRRRNGNGAVLIYAGDFDPSGEDIDRDFVERVGVWRKVVRVALNPDQIEQYNLPPAPGKASDPRAKGFVERHGELVQVELDALPPDTLEALYREALDEYFDPDAHQAVLDREAEQRVELRVRVEEAAGVLGVEVDLSDDDGDE